MQHYGERAKTGWFRIRIMCQSGATCLPADKIQYKVDLIIISLKINLFSP